MPQLDPGTLATPVEAVAPAPAVPAIPPPPQPRPVVALPDDDGVSVSVPRRMLTKQIEGEPRAQVNWLPASIFGDGDNHYPIACPYGEAAKVAFIRDVRPQLWVNTGDLLDCWFMSRYDKEADRLFSGYGARLQDEIDSARPYVETVLGIVKEGHFIPGNHEHRSSRMIDANPSLHGLRALQWKRVLEHPDNLIVHPYNTLLRIGAYPLYYTHGDMVPPGVKHPAAWMLAHAGHRTTVFGHNHKAVEAYRTIYTEEGPTVYGAVCQGHGSIVSEQRYAGPEPDWQHAFTFIEGYTVAGKPRFSVHLIKIIDGRFMWNGRLYDGHKTQ